MSWCLLEDVDHLPSAYMSPDRQEGSGCDEVEGAWARGEDSVS